MGEFLHIRNASPTIQQDDCSIYQLQNDTGEGVIVAYSVFPGVFLFYNDFHMSDYQESFQSEDKLFCIDHCREGRMEYEASEGKYAYVEAGDLKLDLRLKHEGRFSFPLNHYHGMTLVFKLEEAAKALPQEMKDFPIDLFQLQEKFCQDDWPQVIRDAPAIDHVMGELYGVPEKIKLPYFKVKTLELLLYLDALEIPETSNQRPYFYKSQVEKIKALHRFTTAHLERHYTLEELSQRFEISLTAMKSCFKATYGHPINTYMRMYRMNQAAIYLKQDKEASVTEIAGRVGYDSASKFAAAFKSLMGESPLAYRQSSFLIKNKA